ncbi:LysR family transcriptional regulator [Priestia koreensis]|uniref:LysR family transcriptional regulator n=1 Tax=Priestia koreensis TaxID=284581 RepID=UPI001F5774F0|nr:LysR family transcriptional regulator [Priestia koreensis]UNL83743.1 LysR family transcriptional regulator [Priestia koreensis]
MEWEQLEYFQTLARMEHMTKAADVLSISQPALSRSIARLESHLNVQLFDRQGRVIKLNKYGQMFLKRVDAMINEYEKGKEEIQQLLQPDQGEISFGFLHTLGAFFVPDLLASFRQHYPKVNFQLQQNHSYWLLEKLKTNELDLCVFAAIEPTKMIHWVKLWSEDLFLFVPSEHPLAGCDEVELKEIAEEPFILLKSGYALRLTVDELLEKEKVKPTIIFEGEEVSTIAGFVGAGLGVSILPDVEGLDHQKITKVKMKNHTTREIGIGWLEGKYLSPVAEKFKEYILSYSKHRSENKGESK